jgi:hypothetical protein
MTEEPLGVGGGCGVVCDGGVGDRVGWGLLGTGGDSSLQRVGGLGEVVGLDVDYPLCPFSQTRTVPWEPGNVTST